MPAAWCSSTTRTPPSSPPFAASLRTELAPHGVLQADLVMHIVSAAWRARRADRLEAALLDRHLTAGSDPQAALGAGPIRDGNGPRTLETLLRYRGTVQAELFRSLGALRLLQSEPRDLGEAGGADARAPHRSLPRAGAPALPSSARQTKRTRERAVNQ